MSFNRFDFGSFPIEQNQQVVMRPRFGAKNLFKRLQAKEIFECLSLRNQRVLDFGCGNGFFSIECAKRGASVLGVDVVSQKDKPKIATAYDCQFLQIPKEGELPLEKHSFDFILLSEVLIVLPDPVQTLKQLRRLLKPNGQLVIINTLGRKNIEQAYQNNSVLIRLAKKLFKNTPASYQDFCALFLNLDHLQSKEWPSLETIQSWLNEAEFQIENTLLPFKALPSNMYSWMQFLLICRSGQLTVPFSLPLYLFMECLKSFGKKNDVSNFMLFANNKGVSE